MSIKKDNYGENLSAITAWAKNQKAKVDAVSGDDAPQSFTVRKGDWGVEIIPERGWAYVHGKGALKNYSTNIESFDELNDAVQRMMARRDGNTA